MPWNEEYIRSLLQNKKKPTSPATEYLSQLFGQANEQGDSFAFEPLFPGAPPELSIPKTTLNSYRDQIKNSDNPLETEDRLKAAYMASQMYGIPIETAYNDYASITQEMYGRVMRPKDWGEAMFSTLKAAVISVEIARLSNELWKKGPNVDYEKDPIWQQIQQLQVSMPPKNEIKRNIPVEALKKLAEFLPSSLLSLDDVGLGQLAGGAAGALIGSLLVPSIGIPLFGLTAIGASMAGAATTTAAGARLGAMLAVAKSSRDMERGSEYYEMLNNYQDPKTGDKINPKVAWLWANVYGTIAGVSEAIEFDTLFKGIPGITEAAKGTLIAKAKNLTKDVGQIIEDQAIVKRHFLQFVADAVGKVGPKLADINSEALQETLQETAAIIAEEHAKKITNDLDGTKLTPAAFKEIKDRLVDTYVGSLMAFTAQSAIPGAIKLFVGGAQEAKKTNIEIKTAGVKPSSTALTGAQSEKFESLVKKPIPSGVRFQEVEQLEGERYTLKAGDAKGKLLNAVTYDIAPGEGGSPGKVTILGVENMEDPALARAMLRVLSQRMPGWEIEWEPKTPGEQALKDYIVSTNPRGPQAGLQLYRPYDEIDQKANMDKVYKIIQEQRPDWSIEDVKAGTYVFEKFAARFGIAPEELAQEALAPHIVENYEVDDPSKSFGAAYRKNFEDSLKTVIKLGAKANPSTIMHEMTHAVVWFALANQKNEKVSTFLTDLEAAFGVKDHNWDAEFSGWTDEYKYENRSAYEAVAYALEDYIAFKKAPEGKEGILAKLAQFVIDIYHGLKNARVNLSPQIEGFFDKVLADEDINEQTSGATEEMIKAQQDDTEKGPGQAQIEPVDKNNEPLASDAIAPAQPPENGTSKTEAMTPDEQDLEIFQGEVQTYKKRASASLEKAKAMDAEGYSKQDIKQETGWAKTVAGWVLAKDWKWDDDHAKELYQGSARTRRTVKELADYAKEASDWKDFYTKHEQTLREIFGEDTALFKKLLSATSQLASVPSNVGLAIKAYRQMKTGEPFVGYLPAVVQNLERIRSGQEVSGLKISQYNKATDGEASGVAVDRHIAELLYNTTKPIPAQIKKAIDKINKVADILGWEPREVQAALWAYNQIRKGKEPRRYDDFIRAKQEEIRRIRAGITGGERAGIQERPEAGSGAGNIGQQRNDTEPAREGDGAIYQGEKPVWRYKTEDVIEEKLKGAMPGRQILKTIKAAGVKADEIKWTGLDDFLDTDEKKTPQEVKDFLAANKLQIQEVMKGAPSEAEYADFLTRHGIDTTNPSYEESFWRNAFNEERRQPGTSAPKYSKYTIPGGENYREILFTLPTELEYQMLTKGETAKWEIGQDQNGFTAIIRNGEVVETYPSGIYRDPRTAASLALPRLKQEIDGKTRQWVTFKTKEERLAAIEKEYGKGAIVSSPGLTRDNIVGKYYSSSHWGEPNVLAHTRLDDRTTADGKRVLFVEEIQSDWHQEGRRDGYQDDTVINPEDLRATKKDDAYWEISTKDGKFITNVLDPAMTERQAMDEALRRIGNEPKRIAPNKGVPSAPFAKTWHEFVFKRILRMAADGGYDAVAWTTGEQQAERYGLEDSSGMVGFYDKMLVDFANKYGKKWGAIAEDIDLNGDRRNLYDIYNEEGIKEYWNVPENRVQEFLEPGGTAKKQGVATVHSIPVTDAMLESVGLGQYLFQGTPDPKSKQYESWHQERYDAKFQTGKAIQAALTMKKGIFENATYVDEIGPVAFIWGFAGTEENGYHDGFGISHILAAHEDTDNVIANLEKILKYGKVTEDHGSKQKPTRRWIEWDGYRAIIETDRNGKNEPWLVTAFLPETAKARKEVARVVGPSTIGPAGPQAGDGTRSPETNAPNGNVVKRRIVVKRISRPNDVLSQGVHVYHGSAAGFDKFSTKWIGTGEGAQAYGWGLYFSENFNTAKKQYADRLGEEIKIVSASGLAISADQTYILDFAEMVEDMNETVYQMIRDEDNIPIIQAAMRELLKEVKRKITARGEKFPMLTSAQIKDLLGESFSGYQENVKTHSEVVTQALRESINEMLDKYDYESGFDPDALIKKQWIEALDGFVEMMAIDEEVKGFFISGGKFMYEINLALRGENPGEIKKQPKRWEYNSQEPRLILGTDAIREGKAVLEGVNGPVTKEAFEEWLGSKPEYKILNKRIISDFAVADYLEYRLLNDNKNALPEIASDETDKATIEKVEAKTNEIIKNLIEYGTNYYMNIFGQAVKALGVYLFGEDGDGKVRVIPKKEKTKWELPPQPEDIEKMRKEYMTWVNEKWTRDDFVEKLDAGDIWDFWVAEGMEDVPNFMGGFIEIVAEAVQEDGGLEQYDRENTGKGMYEHLRDNMFNGDQNAFDKFLARAGITDLHPSEEYEDIELQNTLITWNTKLYQDQLQALKRYAEKIGTEVTGAEKKIIDEARSILIGAAKYETGGDFYSYLAKILGEGKWIDRYGEVIPEGRGDRAASDLLYRAGFDGVRVPVAFLTGARGGKGWNYVAFDDSHVEITRRTLYQGEAPQKPLYIEEMERAIKDGTSIDELIEFFEAPFNDREEWGIPDLPPSKRIAWYKEQYAALTSPENQAPVTLEAWLKGLKQNNFAGLQNFLKSIYEKVVLVEESKPGPWADREEVEAWDQERTKAFEIRQQIAAPVMAAVLRVGAKGMEMRDAFAMSVYGIIAKNPEEYAAIYAEVMGDEKLKALATKATAEKYADIENPKITATMPISKKREIAEQIRDDQISKAIRNGELGLDEKTKEYIQKVESDSKASKKKIANLEKEIASMEVSIDAGVKRIAEQRLQLQETEKQIGRIISRITKYIDDDGAIPPALEEKRKKLEARKAAIRKKLVEALDWQEINRQYEEAKNRYSIADEEIAKAHAEGKNADPKITKAKSEALKKMEELKPKLATSAVYKTSAELQTYMAKLEERVKLQDEYAARKEEEKAMRELRAYRKRLIDSILQDPAKSANVEYKKAIKVIQDIIQHKYDAKIGPQERAAIADEDDIRLADAQNARVSNMLNSVSKNPAIAQIVTPEWLAQFASLSRREIPLRLWEEAFEKVSALRKIGREVQMQIEADRARENEATREAVVENLKMVRGYKEAEGPDSRETIGEMNKEKFKAFDYSFQNARRFLRAMDGGTDGANVEFAWHQMNRLYRQEMENSDRRQKMILDAIKESGHDPRDWYDHTVTIAVVGKNDSDTVLRKSDLMALALGFRDENSRQALLYGNFFSETEKERYRKMARESEEGKELAYQEIEEKGERKFKAITEAIDEALDDSDWAILDDVFEKDGKETAPRLSEIVARVDNEEMKEIEHYFPILRKGVTGQDIAAQVAEDITSRVPGLRVPPKHGFTKDRIKIAPWNQGEVEMDLLGTWLKSIERQEHYIAYAEYGKKLDAVYLDKKVQEQIKNAFGAKGLEYIQDYIAEIKNPSEMRRRPMQEEALRTLRGNLGAAYLSWRLSSVMKQIVTSPWPALPYAGPGLFVEAAKLLANPVRYVEDAEKLSTVLKHRSFSMVNEAIKGANAKTAFGRITKRTQELGMKGLEWADKTCVAIGWMAIYNKAIKEFNGDQQKAIEKADDIILMTQPTSRGVDLPPAYRAKSEAWQSILQFTQALNVIYQNLRYDMPAAVKAHQVKQAIGIAVAYAISGVLLQAMISRPHGDDEPWEKKAARYAFWSISQGTDSIPLVGEEVTRIAKRAILGEKDPRFAGSAIPGIAQFMDGLYSLSGDDIDNAIIEVSRGLGMLAGAPVSGIKEITAVVRGNPESLIGRRPER